MRATVLGGTGAIGYPVVRMLAARGHAVTAVARTAARLGDLPSIVAYQALDVLAAEIDLAQALEPADALVLALGPDDRHAFRRPAWPHLQAGIVSLTERVLAAAASLGVRRVVIAGSYFTYLWRRHPWFRPLALEPYVRARLAQTEIAFRHGDAVSVVLLELPFVFGAAPGRPSLWAPVVRYARSRLPLLTMRGGTTMVAADTVAEAIARAIELDVPSGAYPLGERFLTWKAWLELLAQLAGRARYAHVLPRSLPFLAGAVAERWARARGTEHGVDRQRMVSVLRREMRIEPEDLRSAQRVLGIEASGLRAALVATVAGCS